MYVFFEILIVVSMKQHPFLIPFGVDLLQRYRWAGHILGKVLAGALIKNPYAVVYTEA